MTAARRSTAPHARWESLRSDTRSPHSLRRLGVGYDGSPESEAALTAARELASAHGGGIQAFWVVSLKEVREDKPIPADVEPLSPAMEPGVVLVRGLGAAPGRASARSGSSARSTKHRSWPSATCSSRT